MIDKDRLLRFIKMVAEDDNWNYATDYGPYGSYTVKTWLGRDDLLDEANELLNDLEGDNNG